MGEVGALRSIDGPLETLALHRWCSRALQFFPFLFSSVLFCSLLLFRKHHHDLLLSREIEEGAVVLVLYNKRERERLIEVKGKWEKESVWTFRSFWFFWVFGFGESFSEKDERSFRE